MWLCAFTYNLQSIIHALKVGQVQYILSIVYCFAIVRALAGRPSLLLLDEPFSAVDRKTRLALHSLLRELSPRVPGPTIYVTHSAEDARALAESVVSFEAGKLVTFERPWEADDAELPPQ